MTRAARRTHGEVMGRRVRQVPEQASLLASQHRATRRPPVILIADDATDTRDLYADYFGGRGFTVVTAHNGARAVQAALDHAPDVIVMDLAMPQFDGITAMRRIKVDARLRRTRVILVTGYAYTGLEQAALQAGADRVLTKPCLPEELERHVNAVRRGRGGS